MSQESKNESSFLKTIVKRNKTIEIHRYFYKNFKNRCELGLKFT